MRLDATAVHGKSSSLSVGEVLTLSLRWGSGVALLRGLEQSLAAWHEHRDQPCPTGELQLALNHFRVQAKLSAVDDFHAFLKRIGAELEEVLDVFRAGFYRALLPPDVQLSTTHALTVAASQLLPAAAFVQGAWSRFVERAAWMLTAFEAHSALGVAAWPQGLSGIELRDVAEQLGVSPERLELLGRICNCYQQLCTRAIHQPDYLSTRHIMATDLTQVTTVEAHAPDEEMARELYACAAHDEMDLPELCLETNVPYEQCQHQVTLLRSRSGWQRVAFAVPGQVLFLGAWDGAFVVLRVLARRAPSQDDVALQERVAEAVVQRQLARARERVRVALD